MPLDFVNKSTSGDGVLIASDENQEWLLPWWWRCYTKKNCAPVTFIDLGLSEKGVQWCRERGEVIPLHFEGSLHEELVDPPLRKKWESLYGLSVWQARISWFKKPLALLHTPYQRTLWLDLDCEVLGDLTPLFHCAHFAKVSLVREYTEDVGLPERPEVIYNSGVIVYDKGSELILQWAKRALVDSHLFLGDQDLLSYLIHTEKWAIQELPYIYNWRIARQGVSLDAQIVHWVGNWGKAYIKQYGGMGVLYQSQ